MLPNLAAIGVYEKADRKGGGSSEKDRIARSSIEQTLKINLNPFGQDTNLQETHHNISQGPFPPQHRFSLSEQTREFTENPREKTNSEAAFTGATNPFTQYGKQEEKQQKNSQDKVALDQLKIKNTGRFDTTKINVLKFEEQLKLQKEQTQNTLMRLKSFDVSKAAAKIQREVSINMRQKMNEFNGEAIPPDFEKAKAHRMATKVGPEKDINDMKEDEDIGYCECCARQIQRTQLSVKCNIYELSFLGSGYPLYFQFMKQCMMLLTLVLFSSGLFNVVTNILGRQSCKDDLSSSTATSTTTSTTTTQEEACNKGGWISLFSLGSKSQQKTFMDVQGYLNLASLVAMIFLLQFFRKLQRELDTKCDAEDIAANDYTLIVKKIPIDFEALNDDYDDDLKDFIEKHGLDDKQMEVESVTLCYSLQEINILEDKKINLIRKKQKFMQKINDLKKEINKEIAHKKKDSQENLNQNHDLPKNSLNEFKQDDDGVAGQLKNHDGQRGMYPEESLFERSVLEKQERRTSNILDQHFGVQMKIHGQLSPNSSNKIVSSGFQDANQQSDLPILHQNKGIEGKDNKNGSFHNNSTNKVEDNNQHIKLQIIEENQQHALQISKLSKKMLALMKNHAIFQTSMKRIDIQLKTVTRKLKLLNDKLMDGKGRQFMRQYFTGIAFVCLRYEQDKEDIIDKYRPIGFFDRLLSKTKLTSSSMIYHNQKLQIYQAPDPTDVCWVNLHYSTREKLKRRIQGFFFTVACLLGCAFAIYIFHDFQESDLQAGSSAGSFRQQVVSSMLAVLISILNALLAYILQATSNYCKYSTRTEMNIFIAKGLSIARFINSAIISFVIQVVLSSKSSEDSLFGEGGLAENANYFMISNCFVTAFAQMLNLDYYWTMFLRYIELRNGEASVLTQLELNELFENPQFPIEERYAQLLMTMFTTAFYCPIVPMTIFWSLIGIFMQYWIDKYKLIRRSSVKFNMSAELSIEMTEHLEYFLPIQSISTLIFYQYVNGGTWGLVSILGTILGLLHAFLPMQMINERLFSVEKAEANVLDYQGASKFFITDYSRENPIYKVSARQTHVMKMIEQVSNQKYCMRTNSIKPNLAPATVGSKEKTINYISNNKDIINLENLQEEDSGLEKGDSEGHDDGSSECVQPPKPNKPTSFIAPSPAGSEEKTDQIVCIQNAKISDTIILFDEEPSVKQPPQESTGNIRRKNYMANKESTNETNLNLIEEEEEENNDANDIRIIGIQSINSPNTTTTHNNILNTFQFLSQQGSQDIHLNNLNDQSISSGVQSPRIHNNIIPQKKQQHFGPFSIADKQPKKDDEDEHDEIQTPTHPLPRGFNHNGYSDAADLALTDRETFRNTSKSPNSKGIEVHADNDAVYTPDKEEYLEENMEDFNNISKKESWRQLESSERSSDNNISINQQEFTARPFNTITKAIEGLPETEKRIKENLKNYVQDNSKQLTETQIRNNKLQLQNVVPSRSMNEEKQQVKIKINNVSELSQPDLGSDLKIEDIHINQIYSEGNKS